MWFLENGNREQTKYNKYQLRFLIANPTALARCCTVLMSRLAILKSAFRISAGIT